MKGFRIQPRQMADGQARSGKSLKSSVRGQRGGVGSLLCSTSVGESGQFAAPGYVIQIFLDM